MNIVVPFGFFGAGNIGDESTLQGFARLVARSGDGMRVRIASRNPSHTARVEPAFRYHRSAGLDVRRWMAQATADGHAVVGGTPIMDVQGAWPLSEVSPLVEAAHGRGRPVVFVGAGTEALQHEASRRVVADRLAPRVRHWSVRSERDRDRLTAYGVAPNRITVAADLAWTLPPVTGERGRDRLREWGVDVGRTLIGVNVTNERFVRAQEPRLLERMADALDALVEKYDVGLVFLANEVRDDDAFDAYASRHVVSAMTHRDRAWLVPNRYWTPQEMLELIAACSMTIGMRYHFCLFSAIQAVPFIALKRSGKVEDLCADLDWPYGISLEEFGAPLLTDMVSQILERHAALRDQVRRQAASMAERSARNAVALAALSSDRA